MSGRSRKVIAWIALALMALFVAALTGWCFDRKLLNGTIGLAAIFTGGLALGLFIILQLSRPRDANTEQTEARRDEPTTENGNKDKDATGSDHQDGPT